MRILVASLLLSLLVPSAFSQPAQTDTPVRYGFVKGREYVYRTVWRQLDKTEAPDHYGDNFLHTRCVSVCVQDVDSAGNLDLVVSTTDERYEPIGDLDAASIDGQSMGQRPMSEPKYWARISATGEFLQGAILEMTAERRNAQEALKRNPGPGRLTADSTLVKSEIRSLLPVLPSPKRISTGVGDTPSPSKRWNWSGDFGCKLTSTIRDSIANARRVYSVLETMQPSENFITQGSFRTQFERYSMRGVFRNSDGVVTEWKRLVQTRFIQSDVPKRNQSRYLFEEIVTLEEEKPCTP
jgi:hypothetical protein